MTIIITVLFFWIAAASSRWPGMVRCLHELIGQSGGFQNGRNNRPPAYRRFAGAIGWVFLACCFSRIVSAIPPRMAVDANTKRRVIGSPRITAAPKAAMTGTLSCTVAALVAFNEDKTAYQMA